MSVSHSLEVIDNPPHYISNLSPDLFFIYILYSTHHILPFLHKNIYPTPRERKKERKMSWEKSILSEGNGVDMPPIGATVKIDYTGWLRDPNSGDHEKGTQYE